MVAPFYDATLEERIEEVRGDWAGEAQRALDAVVRRTPGYARLRTETEIRTPESERKITLKSGR